MAFDMIMPDGKTLQIATVHNLGTTFAHTFDIQFENEDGTHVHVEAYKNDKAINPLSLLE